MPGIDGVWQPCMHSFQVTASLTGSVSFTVTDTHNPSITGTTTVYVFSGFPNALGASVADSSSDTTLPNEYVTTLTSGKKHGTPDGTASF